MPVPPFVDNERAVEIPWLVARLDALRPPRILDVGAADGFYVPELLATGADVTLCDVRPFAPLFLAGPHPRCHVTVHATGAYPAAWDGAFDVVISVSAIDHVGLDAYGQTADPAALAQFVADLARVTAPGGHLLITAPIGRDRWTTHPGGGQRVFSRAALHALFPADAWAWEAMDVWRYADGRGYVPAPPDQADDAAYLGHRAEAVGCLALRRMAP